MASAAYQSYRGNIDFQACNCVAFSQSCCALYKPPAVNSEARKDWHATYSSRMYSLPNVVEVMQQSDFLELAALVKRNGSQIVVNDVKES